MKFNVQLKGLESMQRQILTASDKVAEVCKREIQEAGQQWVAGAVRDAPVDQAGAGLKSAISSKSVSELEVEIIAQKFYAPFMEFGTKGKYQPIPGTENIAAQFKNYKGKRGDLFEAIKKWVKRKGIGAQLTKSGNPSKSKSSLAAQESAAFLIALSILRNGINPHPYFFKQGETVWPAMVERLRKALQSETRVSVIMPGEIKRPKYITI